MYKIILMVCAALLFQGNGYVEAQRRTEGITIYYTASLNGNLDGCDCKGSPVSGLVKTGYFLAGRDYDRSVLIDAGDFLDADPDELLSEYILESFQDLEYTALAVGDQEFAGGLDTFIRYNREYPLLSNNLSVRVNGRFEAVSPLPLRVSRAGVDIGIFSVIDPEAFALYPWRLTRNLRTEPAADTAVALVTGLESSGADLVIGIFHGTVEAAWELAGSVGGIDVLLVGHEQRLVEAEKMGETLIVSPGDYGNRVGILELDVRRGSILEYNNSFRTFNYIYSPDYLPVRERVDDYYAELVRRLRESGQ